MKSDNSGHEAIKVVVKTFITNDQVADFNFDGFVGINPCLEDGL
jgi:hypothetical protein